MLFIFERTHVLASVTGDLNLKVALETRHRTVMLASNAFRYVQHIEMADSAKWYKKRESVKRREDM
jgi:hypothetical protein